MFGKIVKSSAGPKITYILYKRTRKLRHSLQPLKGLIRVYGGVGGLWELSLKALLSDNTRKRSL